MHNRLRVLVIGGRGYVGRAICEALSKHDVFTFDRHGDGKSHISGNILSISDLKNAMKNKDVVINLVGLTPVRRPKGITYEQAHVEGAKNVVKACKAMKIKKLVHMSAVGANKNSVIEYIRTKGLGEELVLHSGLNVTVFCPAIIFDKGHELIKTALKMRWLCSFPNVKAKMRPVYRQDIAKLYALAVDGKIKERKIEVGGSQVMTLFEFVKKIINKKGFPCFPVPLFFVKIGLYLASWFHLFGITKDQIRSLCIDNTTPSKAALKYLKLTSLDDWLSRTEL